MRMKRLLILAALALGGCSMGLKTTFTYTFPMSASVSFEPSAAFLAAQAQQAAEKAAKP